MPPRWDNDPTYRRNRAVLKTTARAHGTPCARCHQPIAWTARHTSPRAFTAGHITDRAIAERLGWPAERTHALDNLQPEHLGCNASAGATAGNLARAGAPPPPALTVHLDDW